MEERHLANLHHNNLNFEEVYAHYYQCIFDFVFSFVKSTDTAEDITQDLFIKIYEKKNEFNNIENIKAYLLTSAKNATLNYLKKASREEQIKNKLVFYYDAQKASLEDDLADIEYTAYLKASINQLSERNKVVFNLCRNERKTYEEVSQELGISQSAVKKHMVKSMKTLRFLLKKDFGLLLVFLFYCSK
jgi:RNA polymerase sigma-70 factor (family 1)